MKNEQTILDNYLECALWTDEKDEKTISDVGASTITQAKKDITAFVEKSGKLLDEWSEEEIGHDFWLTRNHHGAGFWDRGRESGDKLTEIAQTFKALDVWESELGIIYFE
jgi:hypothetical protein